MIYFDVFLPQLSVLVSPLRSSILIRYSCGGLLLWRGREEKTAFQTTRGKMEEVRERAYRVSYRGDIRKERKSTESLYG
jgi:hypothetical protein